MTLAKQDKVVFSLLVDIGKLKIKSLSGSLFDIPTPEVIINKH